MPNQSFEADGFAAANLQLAPESGPSPPVDKGHVTPCFWT